MPAGEGQMPAKSRVFVRGCLGANQRISGHLYHDSLRHAGYLGSASVDGSKPTLRDLLKTIAHLLIANLEYWTR